MEIKTKYNIGDKVWFMENNHIVHSTICGYCISYGVGAFYGKYGTGDPQIDVSYNLRGGDVCVASVMNIKEDELFPTKEELLKSL